MPLPKGVSFEAEIELNRFKLSKEWQAISERLDDATKDYIDICLDIHSDLEQIRFAQGAIAMIVAMRGLPDLIFKGEVKDNGRDTD